MNVDANEDMIGEGGGEAKKKKPEDRIREGGGEADVNEGRIESVRNRTRVVDAMRETGET